MEVAEAVVLVAGLAARAAMGGLAAVVAVVLVDLAARATAVLVVEPGAVTASAVVALGWVVPFLLHRAAPSLLQDRSP